MVHLNRSVAVTSRKKLAWLAGDNSVEHGRPRLSPGTFLFTVIRVSEFSTLLACRWRASGIVALRHFAALIADVVAQQYILARLALSVFFQVLLSVFAFVIAVSAPFQTILAPGGRFIKHIQGQMVLAMRASLSFHFVSLKVQALTHARCLRSHGGIGLA